METEKLISMKDFCIHHSVEYTFINSLSEFGMIEIITVEEKQFIKLEQIRNLEQMIRLHYELNINMEGIDAISHLLKRMNDLQEELLHLRNKIQNEEHE